jgi:hypothetical protein
VVVAGVGRGLDLDDVAPRQHAVGIAAVQVEGALARGQNARARQIRSGADHRGTDLGRHLALAHARAGGGDGGLHPRLCRLGGDALIGQFRRRLDEAQSCHETAFIGDPQLRQSVVDGGPALRVQHPGIHLNPDRRRPPQPLGDGRSRQLHPVVAVGPHHPVAKDAGRVEVIFLDIPAEQRGLALGRHDGELKAAVAPGEEAGDPGHGLGLEGQQCIKPAAAQLLLHPCQTGAVFLRFEPIGGLGHRAFLSGSAALDQFGKAGQRGLGIKRVVAWR